MRPAIADTTRVIVVFAVLAIGVLAACAKGSDPNPDDLNPSLLSDAGVHPNGLCVQTDCPAPLATCTSGGLCTTDTSSDVNHCGACDTPCPRLGKSFNATSVCTNGKCDYACDEFTADCNKNPADGCEVSLEADPNNCGGCGVKCDAGVICWRGACGCPDGWTVCDGECVDTQSDLMNCGSCGNLCTAPKSTDSAWTCGPEDQPPNTAWQCVTGACKLECKPPYQDCNDNFCGDGCEVDTSQDPKNCGGCGTVCAEGQACVDGTCLCPPNTTRCGDQCVDLNVDVLNCGSCGNDCPGPGGFGDRSLGGGPSCSGGQCGYTCYPGYRDCNGRIVDGCEVNVAQDPNHCGDCNTKCDTAQGQPCVAGVCLTKPCTPSGPVN